MDCKEARSLADSYLSEQLLVETNHAIVAHLERCPPCRAEFDDLRRLRNATRSAVAGARHLHMRPEFGVELRARLRASATSAPRRNPLRSWLPIAAGLLLAVGGVATAAWLSPDAAERLAHFAAGDHQNCALKFRLPERPITLAAAGERIDPAFARLATVEPSAATLSGGSVRVAERHACVFEGQPFAHVVVIYKDVAVSVLVAERGTGNAWWRRSTLRTMAVGGDFHIAEFDSADHAVFVVSTLPLADVQVIARAMMQPLANAIAGT